MKIKVNTKQHVSESFARKFKMGYAYKMGGTQTVVMPNGQSFYFDDREYYSGRGSKYNKSINHDLLGIVSVSKKDFNIELQHEKEMRKYQKERVNVEIEKRKKYFELNEKGIYGISKNDGTLSFIDLSDEESNSKTYNAEKLAKTLDISVHDASLLRSGGKTYVFAKQISTGKIIELYHSSLDCNPLNISFDFPDQKEIDSFNHDEWASAPYAGLVGMTENKNHFVC